jgi:hypothetical protein
MRYLIVACLFLLCAAGLMACSDPPRVARREVDRIVKITLRTEVAVKRDVRAAMLDVAKSEGQRRGAELKLAGCVATMASQPSATLAEPCKGVVAASEARYETRLATITGPAKRVNLAIGAVYAALLAVLDLVEDIEAGMKAAGWEAKLVAVTAQASRTYTDCVAAYTALKAALTGGGK